MLRLVVVIVGIILAGGCGTTSVLEVAFSPSHDEENTNSKVRLLR